MAPIASGNDARIIMQLARGTEAIALAENISSIARVAEEERRKAHERFQLESHSINDGYLSQMLHAIREYNNRMDLLEYQQDSSDDSDD